MALGGDLRVTRAAPDRATSCHARARPRAGYCPGRRRREARSSAKNSFSCAGPAACSSRDSRRSCRRTRLVHRGCRRRNEQDGVNLPAYSARNSQTVQSQLEWVSFPHFPQSRIPTIEGGAISLFVCMPTIAAAAAATYTVSILPSGFPGSTSLQVPSPWSKRRSSFRSRKRRSPFFVGVDLGGHERQGGSGRRPRPDAVVARRAHRARQRTRGRRPADGRGRPGRDSPGPAGVAAAVARVGLGSPGPVDAAVGHAGRPGEPQGLGRIRHGPVARPPLRTARRAGQRRDRRDLRRVLGRLRPGVPQHDPVDAGHGHRLGHHHRRPVDRRRERLRRRVRPHHHQRPRRRPALRLRQDRPSRGLRQRHRRRPAGARGPGRPAAKARFAAGSPTEPNSTPS